MFDQQIPENIRNEFLAQQGLKQQLLERRDTLIIQRDQLASLRLQKKGTSEAVSLRREIVSVKGMIRELNRELAEIRSTLKQLLRECHRYEPVVETRSNVAGDVTQLRMPVTRSGCYPHAAGFATRDDT